MTITYFHRRPAQGDFSLENVFADVREAMPDGVRARVVVSRYPSSGILPRVYNTVEAAFRQSDVNHITGDVLYLTYLLEKRKTVLTVPDLIGTHLLSGVRRRLLILLWYRIAIARSSVVTVISESTKRELLGVVPVDPQKVKVIHCCVSPSFAASPAPFNDTCPTVLFVGTRPNKNLERTASALRKIQCRLRVVGALNDAQRATLNSAAIQWTSCDGLSRGEIQNEYRRCDMLAFASEYEGFGLPILEAQATGRPVVTSRAWSMPEVAGAGACLVNPLDVASIREGILNVIETPAYRDELVSQGFANIQRFKPERIASQYLDLYKSLR